MGCVSDGETRRPGISPSMAMIMRKGLDLAGDGAPGYFVAEMGQFPEPGQDLVATKVELAQPFDFLVYQFSVTALRCSIM